MGKMVHNTPTHELRMTLRTMTGKTTSLCYRPRAFPDGRPPEGGKASIGAKGRGAARRAAGAKGAKSKAKSKTKAKAKATPQREEPVNMQFGDSPLDESSIPIAFGDVFHDEAALNTFDFKSIIGGADAGVVDIVDIVDITPTKPASGPCKKRVPRAVPKKLALDLDPEPTKIAPVMRSRQAAMGDYFRVTMKKRLDPPLRVSMSTNTKPKLKAKPKPKPKMPDGCARTRPVASTLWCYEGCLQPVRPAGAAGLVCHELLGDFMEKMEREWNSTFYPSVVRQRIAYAYARTATHSSLSPWMDVTLPVALTWSTNFPVLAMQGKSVR